MSSRETWEEHREACCCSGDALSGLSACDHCMDECNVDGQRSSAAILHPREQVGMEIRTLHRYGFRSGEWAKITAYVEDAADGPCWLVEFPDDTTDWWRTGDPDGQYEIRSAP